MKLRQFAARGFFALALAALLAAPALADTIKLRDGTTIRGQIIAYKDQQFTVLIGAGARGRRSRITVYMEDVESIEFDNPFGADSGGNSNPGQRTAGDEAVYDDNTTAPSSQPRTQPQTSRPAPRGAATDRRPAPAHPRQRLGHGQQHGAH